MLKSVIYPLKHAYMPNQLTIPPTSNQDMTFILNALHEGKWFILATSCLMLCVSIFYLLTTEPVYRSNVILQLESKNSALNGLEEISQLLFSESASIQAELEILQSRTLIGQVIQQLHLDDIATPLYFPLIGQRLAHWQATSENPIGFSSFAWSNESIHIKKLIITDNYLDTLFTLVAQADDTFFIYDEEENLIVSGQVGQPIINHRIFQYLLISELKAPDGTIFHLSKQSLAVATAELQQRIQAHEKAAQSGIIQVNLEGTDKQLNARILNELARTYIQQNIDRKLKEVDGMLTFVTQQLPSLKQNLDLAEEKLSAYHQKFGAIDIDLETKNLLSKISEFEKQQSTLELIRLDYTKKFTVSHPELVSLKQKIYRLKQEKEKLNKRIQQLPEAQRQSIHVQRDVEIAQAVYSLLVTKSQELSIAKAGVIGNIYQVDPAIAGIKPIKPKNAFILLAGCIFGFFISSLFIVWRKAITNTIDSPDILEQRFNLPIFSIIPHSIKQMALSRKHLTSALLTQAAPYDPSVEGLRSLRTSLEFTPKENRSPCIIISGSTPDIGKSFVAANLLPLYAGIGKRVLLIDADLRKGHLHDVFQTSMSPGLSEVLNNTVELSDAIHSIDYNEKYQMHFLAAGHTPDNPSELLMSPEFQQLIDQTSEQFDAIIIDTPPIGLLTDPAIIAKQANGINLLVIRSGQHQAQDIDIAIQRFQQVDAKLDGIIFNDAKSNTKYNYYYRYER